MYGLCIAGLVDQISLVGTLSLVPGYLKTEQRTGLL